MRYKNASHVLPDKLLKEIQKNVEGEAIYIPKVDEKRKWGEGSGARTYYKERNAKIKEDYQQGISFEELEVKYGLSQERLKHIVYNLNP